MMSEGRSLLIRSSHKSCSVKKGALRNFVTFTEKHMRESLFFNKLAGLVNFTKFLKTPFFKDTSGRLLLVNPLIFA